MASSSEKDRVLMADFDDLDLSGLFRVFLVDGTHHLQSDYRGTVLAQDDVVDVVLFVAFIDEQGTQALTRNVNRSDDGLILLYVLLCKAQCSQVHVLLGGEDAQKALIQHTVHITAHLILNQFLNFIHART